MPDLPFANDSTDALIASRLPAWLTKASLETLYALHESQRWQQQVQHELHGLLARITPLDAFAAPLLQHALQEQHQLTLDVRQATLRRRTLQRFPSYIAHIPDGVKAQVYQHSLLQSALHNFTEGETLATGLMQGSAVLDSGGQTLGLSPNAFTVLCRSLDLGGQYQAYLRGQLTPGGEAGRHIEALMEEGFRASLEAALRQSLVNGEIVAHACEQCAPLLAVVATKSAIAGFEPRQIRVFGLRVRGAVAFQVRHADQEGVLCWIPDDPHGPLTWFASWDLLFLTLGKQFRLPKYVEFFQRFIGERDREAYTRALDHALKRAGQNAPVQLDGRHEAIELPLFEHLRKQQIDTLLDNAKVHAVPTAAVDAQARDRRLHFCQSFALDALGLASFALPVLALPLLGITALQVADEVYEGYADWQLGDRQGALEHAYAVAETLIMTAANVGAGTASHRLARAAVVDEWVPVQTSQHGLKLCDPELPGYAVEGPGALGQLTVAEGREYLRTPLARHLTELDAESQQRHIRHPVRADAYAPLLEGNDAGGWQHELEHPHEWQGSAQLLRDLGHDLAHLDDQVAHEVLRATGLDEGRLRRLHVEHAPPPARLLDAVQRHQLHDQLPWLRDEGFELHLQAQQAPPTADEALLQRDFPGLTVNVAREIIEHATEAQVEHLQARQRVPLALAEQARWYLRDTRLDRACAGLLQAAALNRDSEQLALALIADRAPWRGVRIELRSGTLTGERTAWAGAQAATEVRSVLRTAKGYQALDAYGRALPAANAEDSLFQALLLQLDPWQRRALGEASESPQTLADALSKWASEQRDKVATLLGMAPVGLGFRPPVRLGDGRLGYPLSGRGESSNRALRRGIQRLFPDYDDSALEAFNNTAREQGLTPWNYYLRLCEEQRALDQALGRWRRQSSGPIQLIRRARMARRIRHAWQRRVRDASGNPILVLEGTRLGSLPDLPPAVNFDHVTTLTLRNLELTEVNADFLARFPRVNQLDLSRNRLTAMPDTSHMANLEWVDLSHNRIVDVSEAQAPLLRANPDSVRLHGNPLSAVALERLNVAPPPPVVERVNEHEQWFEGLSEAEAARRRGQWEALRAEADSDAFFGYLAELLHAEDFTRQAQGMRRRVGELLNAMFHHTHVRRAVFEQAAIPRGRADLDVLVIRLQVALRTDGMRGRRVERELRNLGRELFRLDQVDRFAAQHIERLQGRPGQRDQDDIYMAFRVGLAEPLSLYGQPTYLDLQHVDTVTLGDLAEAEAAVHRAETPEALSQFLVQQTFWQDHVRVEYSAQFAAIRRRYGARLAALVPEPGQDHAPSGPVNAIVAQRREEEQVLTLTLARGNPWSWYRLEPPHGPGTLAYAHLSRQLEHSLEAWRGQPSEPEYAARSYVAGVLREAWQSNYRDELPSLGSSSDGLAVSSLPELPAGIQFERLRALSLRNQQLATLSGDFLRRFPNLEDVDLTGNQLSTFEGLEHLPRLRRLYLGGNLLETLDGLGNARQLTDLDLSGNQFVELPAGIEQLEHLASLDLSFNQIAVLDDRAGQLPNLENLQLGGNLLNDVPRSLGNLARLSILNLSANRLTRVPEQLNGLGRLTRLDLRDNAIVLDAQSELRLEWFSRLQVLSLEGNPLGMAPRLHYNVQLRYLSLRATGLRSVPLALLQRHPDMVVDLRGNRIAALSEEALGWIEAHPETVNLEQNHLSEAVMARVRNALARLQAEWARAAEAGEVSVTRKPPGRRG
ncbi:NEL-type E3 ubiquitin ligase domain-containing protein [Pseudomonas kermanshahensis]|uniref:RING-type E3 ubiquitin transferase n=1 Tax=Pseudomonas kermanshahensis TaxID=2745482 RepID=A0ABU8R1I4_9PSED